MDLEKKEELIDFLKENLAIVVEQHSDFYEEGYKIKLTLDGESISKGVIVLKTNYDI